MFDVTSTELGVLSRLKSYFGVHASATACFGWDVKKWANTGTFVLESDDTKPAILRRIKLESSEVCHY